MRFQETKINGVWVVEPQSHEDHRGFFARVWCQQECESHLLNPRVAQINIGFTIKKGGLRGLHFQVAPFEETKTVRCTQGALFDVAVDLRPGSRTYKQWVGVELNAHNHRALCIPEGCAHGCQALEDGTEFLYLTSRSYVSDAARGYRHDDASFAIKWPLPVSSISEADRNWPDFEEIAVSREASV
jgi:dTDP-4-dehydrorhamnose 3,5-epimerase